MIALPAAAKIAGGLTLAAAAGGLAILAYGVAQTGSPPEAGNGEGRQSTPGPVQPATDASPDDCKDSTPVLLDGQPACSFTFEATDVPARLQGFPLQAKPVHTQTFGDILLYGTCAPAGSCQNGVSHDVVKQQRASRLDWDIVASAKIVIVWPINTQTDSIPGRSYHSIDIEYNHIPRASCPNDGQYCADYVFMANYELLTSDPTGTASPQPLVERPTQPAAASAPETTPEPTPASSKVICAHGSPVQRDGRAACSFRFGAEDVPARLQAFPLQVRPERIQTFGDILLHATCVPAGSCTSFATGEPVSEEASSQIDWKINQAATITIVSDETVQTDSIPVREYRFVDFAYDHPADPICTADRVYCYTFMANYERSN